MSTLENLGMTVDELDFGGVDAESDFNLDDYFVETPHVRALFGGRRTQLLGRKGSGKSALFKQIHRVAQEQEHPPLVTTLTPNQYASSQLQSYSEVGLTPQQAHANAWKFTLILEAVSTYVRSQHEWSSEGQKALDVLRKFLQDNFGNVEPGLLKSASSIVKGLSSFNLSAFGFGVGYSGERDKGLVTPAVLDRLVELLQVLAAEKSQVLALDRLDDSWDGSPNASSLLVGLLMSAKELNDRLGGIRADRGTGLRVIIFLRSDIYDVLRFDEKDKHRALEEWILWTPELLREMVNLRLPEGVTVDELFEAGDMRGSLPPFEHIVKRTFLRPREVIQFLDEVQRKAAPGASGFTKDEVRKAEERYSKWKVDDLRQEFSNAFPDFGRLLECLRQGVHRYDTLEDLKAQISAADPELVVTHSPQDLVEKLFEYSVIGIRLNNQGSTRFKAQDNDLTLPTSGAAYVHQSLYKGLAITEARR